MRITVVTPTYNKLHLLRRTLASLEAQDIGADRFELVVVDDGSSDGTEEYLREYEAPFGLEVVRAPANRGRAAARNRGLERASGELVVFLDDDMELVPGFLRAHHELHAGGARVSGIGNVVNHPEVTMAPVDRYMSTRGAQKIKTRGPLPWRYFSTNNSSVLRADLDAVGGFDEDFRYYGFEDLEIAYRLQRQRGLEFRFVEEARSLHIHPHTLKEVMEKKVLCGRSSLRVLFRKHPELRETLGFHRFDRPGLSGGARLNLERAVFALLFTPPVAALVKPFATLPLGEFTNRCLDYLVQYHYLVGLRGPELERS